jgi:hypothetical protein
MCSLIVRSYTMEVERAVLMRQGNKWLRQTQPLAEIAPAAAAATAMAGIDDIFF